MTINRNLAKFAPSINTSGKAAVATITVTVVSSGGNKFAMDGTAQQTVSLSKGITYRFDNSDSSNSGHPLVFSTTSDGTHNSGSAFTTGITTVGTAGNAGAYVEVTLEQDAAATLYYYCSNHSGMGGTVKTAYGNSNVVEDTSPQLGGNLDVNGNSIVSTSNGNISITPNGSGKVIIDGLSHPTADGSANQVLKTDGSGNLSFTTVSSGGLGNISEDTTPQLGGDLDVDGNAIVSTSNGNIAITPNGSGKVVIDGISHPTADGTNGQALVTNGSGVLSFSTISSGGGGGATGGGSDEIFYENDQTVTTNYSISASHNAVTAGPITVNNGVTITVPSGVRWVVV
jgi:plastocyanin